jgi:uridylate kinase
MKKYKRVLLKLSGESLMGGVQFGFEQASCQRIAKSIQELYLQDIDVAVVIGAGNLFRGAQAKDMDLRRVSADSMGMLATMMNGIALKEALSAVGCEAKVLSSVDCPRFIESYSWDRAQYFLDNKYPVIFVGGTGNPFFTTDTAAALRASEMNADIIIKATKVDGVYDKDPKKYPDAKRYSEITCSRALSENLGVMDLTAIRLCMDNRIPILVCDMFGDKSLVEVLENPEYGTLVHSE